MCVIAVKYLPDIGWIGVKNRDRGYYPEINIRKSNKHGIERCYIWDANTKYTEGVNEHGIGIISASMATISDEKGAGTTKISFTKNGRQVKVATWTKVSIMKNHVNGLGYEDGKILVTAFDFMKGKDKDEQKQSLEIFKKEHSDYITKMLGVNVTDSESLDVVTEDE